MSQKVYGVQASGDNSGGKNGDGGLCKGVRNSYSIYNSQGKVCTGNYQNYKGLSEDYRKTVIDAHKKNGSKSSQTASKKDVADTKRQLSELSSTLTEMKSWIAAFSDKPQGNNFSESNCGKEAPIRSAVDSFVGRVSKRTKT